MAAIAAARVAYNQLKKKNKEEIKKGPKWMYQFTQDIEDMVSAVAEFWTAKRKLYPGRVN